MEFFCSPAKLKSLLEELSHHPNLSYHALNAKGEEYTNNTAAGQGKCNAVTWGVFPGREIVQPTVVDAAAFGIWKVGEIGSDRLSVSDLKQPNPTRTHHTCCPTTATIPPPTGRGLRAVADAVGHRLRGGLRRAQGHPGHPRHLLLG